MNKLSIKTLLDMTSEFYTACAQDFSKTRQAGWGGWAECAQAIERVYAEEARHTEARRANETRQANGARKQKPLKILDVACGNMRFERWLCGEHPEIDFHALAVDSCAPLAQNGQQDQLRGCVDFELFDIGEWLLELDDSAANETFPFLADNFNIAVCFGFLHHMPGVRARVQLLCALLDAVKSGGFVVISFWCFARNAKMLARAQETTRTALNCEKRADEIELEENDYLLGFNDIKGVYRYCHSFTDDEIDYLLSEAAKNVPTKLITRFSSDGRGNNLNEYVILQKL